MTVDIYLPLYKKDLSLFERSLQSVLSQDNQDWRLTIVDDRKVHGSDASDLIAEKAGGLLAGGQIRYVSNDENLGLVGAHNRCLELAFQNNPLPDDALITFLGDDDELEPNYVRDVTRAHSTYPNAAFIQTAVTPIDYDGKPVAGFAALPDRIKSLIGGSVTEPTIRGGEELAASLLHGNWMYFQGTAFHKKALEGRKFTEAPFVMDFGLYMDLIADGKEGLYIPEKGIRYRRHSTSETSRVSNDGSRFATEREFLGKQRARMRELGWPAAAQAAGVRWTSRLNAALTAGKFAVGGRVGDAAKALGHAVAVRSTPKAVVDMSPASGAAAPSPATQRKPRRHQRLKPRRRPETPNS